MKEMRRTQTAKSEGKILERNEGKYKAVGEKL